MTRIRDAIIFLGPSLRASEAREALDAHYLPPAAVGDIYRVVRERPRVVGLVDGYFDRMPAPWHKEILFALEHGVYVFGASSMGALRSAELSTFGMRGVGAVFQGFQSGELEADDEVAIVHADESLGYLPMSVALVDIRHTMAAAVAEGVLAADQAQLLVDLVQKRWFPERSYEAVLADAKQAGVPSQDVHRLEKWLPTGRRSVKRTDALEMLAAIRDLLAEDPPPFEAGFDLNYTAPFDDLRRDEFGAIDTGRAMPILEELRILPRDYGEVWEQTFRRWLSLEIAQRDGYAVDPVEVEAQETGFRSRHGLNDHHSVQKWLESQDLTQGELERLLRDEAAAQWVARTAASEIEARLPDTLKLTGRWGALRDRAAQKAGDLREQGAVDGQIFGAGPTAEELVEWYFKRLGQPVPVDLEYWARLFGFINSAELTRALHREWHYVRSGRDGRVPPCKDPP